MQLARHLWVFIRCVCHVRMAEMIRGDKLTAVNYVFFWIYWDHVMWCMSETQMRLTEVKIKVVVGCVFFFTFDSQWQTGTGGDGGNDMQWGGQAGIKPRPLPEGPLYPTEGSFCSESDLYQFDIWKKKLWLKRWNAAHVTVKQSESSWNKYNDNPEMEHHPAEPPGPNGFHSLWFLHFLCHIHHAVLSFPLSSMFCLEQPLSLNRSQTKPLTCTSFYANVVYSQGG